MPDSPLAALMTFSAKLVRVSENRLGKKLSRVGKETTVSARRNQARRCAVEMYIPETSVGHRQCSRTSTILSLDNLITTELHTVRQCIQLVLWHADLGVCQAPQRYNGLTTVTTNNGYRCLSGVLGRSDLGDESLGTDDVKSGHTEELLGVEDVGGLEDLGGDGDGAVDGVGDDEDVGLGAVLGYALDEVADDTGVDLEEVVTGHARLACRNSLSGRAWRYWRIVHIRGIPAGMTTMSAPVKAPFMPSSLGR